MNILLIGNGFDLAHGLPTKYTDFLEWIKIIIEIGESLEWVAEMPDEQSKLTLWLNDNKRPELWTVNLDKLSIEEYYRQLEKEDFNFGDDYFMDEIMKEAASNSSQSMLRVFNYTFKNLNNMHISVKKKLENEVKNGGNNGKNKELYYLIKNNIWIDYFLNCETLIKENWIDFENEISTIIQSIDHAMYSLNSGLHKLYNINNVFVKQYFSQYEELSILIIRDHLYRDLNRLIRLLEIYLSEYAENIDDMNGSRLSVIDSIQADRILSFNYTDTYKNIYGKSKDIKYDYIHGKAKISNTIESNNMVLGIDEYLSDDRKNKDLEFLAFRKFYQRIYKGTGSEYKNWIDKIKEDLENITLEIQNNYVNIINLRSEYKDKREGFHNLYIFGHSLDITDKDVLRDLLLNDNVYTTIFYPNRKELERKITNLVKVIGQDELIRRTGGSTKTIEFKMQ